jgi:hypothetical protein
MEKCKNILLIMALAAASVVMGAIAVYSEFLLETPVKRGGGAAAVLAVICIIAIVKVCRSTNSK